MAADHTSGSSSGGDQDIAVMMKQMRIQEEDLDDVIFEQESPPPEIRWLVIATVYTDGEYSSLCFFKNMRSTWDLAQEVKISSLENNLHTFQFSCLGDRERVMDGGPWAFWGNRL
uniref:Uncharacterized protein n=1 Tax=Avena sativa TaxID=4498 RepID=A0ACD5Z572_AVESA